MMFYKSLLALVPFCHLVLSHHIPLSSRQAPTDGGFGPQPQSNIIVSIEKIIDGETLLVDNGVLNEVGQWTTDQQLQGVFGFTNLPSVSDPSAAVGELTPATISCLGQGGVGQGGGVLGSQNNATSTVTTRVNMLTCGTIGDAGFEGFQWFQSEFSPPATNPLVMDAFNFGEQLMAAAAPQSTAPVELLAFSEPIEAVFPIYLRWLGTAD